MLYSAKLTHVTQFIFYKKKVSYSQLKSAYMEYAYSKNCVIAVHICTPAKFHKLSSEKQLWRFEPW